MTKPLIVIVDDDPGLLDTTASALRGAYQVQVFSSATEALEALGSLVPDAIVSDIVMPSVGGFEFRRLYARRFESRRTPFLFLTSLTDHDTHVAGLDAGADDVLTKPVVPAILQARIRALLRRSQEISTTSHRGDLSRVPFSDLLQLCEAKGVTGELVIEASDLRVVLPLKGGQVDESALPWLDRLCDLTEGKFLVRSIAADLQGLGSEPSLSEGPVGRFSSISVRDRALRVQTELVQGEVTMAVTLVMAGDEPLAKLRRSIPSGASTSEVQALIDAQHAEAEAQMQDRVSSIRQKWQLRSPPPPPVEGAPHSVEPARSSSSIPMAPAAPSVVAPPAPPHPDPVEMALKLFDEGFERSLRRDWNGALLSWERALALDPTNRTIAVNVEVARKKLAPDDLGR